MKTLVAGSYPPMPGPQASATLAAVRSAWDDGDEVTVVSPRATAAHHRAHLAGWRSVAALARLSRGRNRLVLVAQPGMPFGDAPDRGASAALASVARWCFIAFDLWLVQPELLPVKSLRPLTATAHRIVVASERERDAASGRLGIPVARIEVDGRAVPPVSRAELRVGEVTAFGPPDWLPREQPRRLASLVIRRVLGKRTDAVRARVVSAVSAGRRARQAARRRLGRNR